MGESDLRCIHSRHVRRLSVSLLQITDERFARPGCAAIGSHVYPFAVGWRLCVPVGIRVTGIYAGTCHIVRNPVLGLPAPSARLGFQMIVAIDRISEHGIGVNISFVRPATLNIAAGDPAEPFHLSNLRGQISPDNGVRNCRNATRNTGFHITGDRTVCDYGPVVCDRSSGFARPHLASGACIMPPRVGRVLLLNIARFPTSDRNLDDDLATTADVLRKSMHAAISERIRVEGMTTVSADPWTEINRVARAHRCASVLLGIDNCLQCYRIFCNIV